MGQCVNIFHYILVLTTVVCYVVFFWFKKGIPKISKKEKANLSELDETHQTLYDQWFDDYESRTPELKVELETARDKVDKERKRQTAIKYKRIGYKIYPALPAAIAIIWGGICVASKAAR